MWNITFRPSGIKIPYNIELKLYQEQKQNYDLSKLNYKRRIWHGFLGPPLNFVDVNLRYYKQLLFDYLTELRPMHLTFYIVTTSNAVNASSAYVKL